MYNNTYLAKLPNEIQDYIWEITKNSYRKEIHSDLLKNIDQRYTINHMESETLYKKEIDFLVTIDWVNLHIYLTSWMDKVACLNCNIYKFPIVEETEIARYVVVLENIFKLLHDKTLLNSSEFGIRTAIMLCVLPLSYMELMSLCKYIKNARIKYSL
tara:strand:- start:745 stop:1215 length:471 start_codon:yes stop_codon:yes gene_type:complete